MKETLLEVYEEFQNHAHVTL